MRVPHKFRLPRKFKKRIGHDDWMEFMYTRIVAEEYPFPPGYSHTTEGIIRRRKRFRYV